VAHGGTITVDSTIGVGTAFNPFTRLPSSIQEALDPPLPLDNRLENQASFCFSSGLILCYVSRRRVLEQSSDD
jgi:hypothetical protein